LLGYLFPCSVGDRQLCCYRLIIRVLLNQPPTNRQIEDRLAQLLDMFRAGREAREMVKMKADDR
jgi:hypothetical protein